ncbi:MAG: 5-bromo-4-chloroindolyl phosphate hydrolysis family protein [Oscillospiraceae bacterium]|nr:5-bromo-4-chloroindolyl phosphate hydrolysis family protein [Oscillospiraceae bacterium]
MANNKNNKEEIGIGYWIGTAIMFMIGLIPIGIIMLVNGIIKVSKSTKSSLSASSAQPTNNEFRARADEFYARQKNGTPTAPAQSAAAQAAPNKPSAKGGAAQDLSDQESSPARPAQKPAAPAYSRQPKKQLSIIDRVMARRRRLAPAHVTALVFAIISAVTAVSTLASAFGFFISGTPLTALPTLPLWIVGASFSAVAITLLGLRGASRERLRRCARYASIIGDKETVAVSSLAAAVGTSRRRVARDLEDMINRGLLPGSAYVDKYPGVLFMSFDAGAPLASADEKPARETVDEYHKILRQLRTLNNDIDDLSISSKIERIETTCGKIFNVVRENPDKLPSLRRFMNYYLPTTQKLLRSYRTLEKQGIAGENIESTKYNIDRILLSLAEGFDRQLDQLFRTDALDIGADIDVLENMMAQDGLSAAQSMSAGGSAAQVLGE